MIDYFFKFADEATAIAAAPDGWYNPGLDSSGWSSDYVLPNVKAWRPSQDVGGVHTFLTGWFAIVSLPDQRAAFLNAAALQFALDRDACAAHLPFVVKNNIGAVITDVACEPIFCGSIYPIGGYN